MSVSTDSASFRRKVPLLAIPVVIALAYATGHLTWYAGTPLGRVPVMDEQENLAFAEAIATSSLPDEPFYRAPGYPLLLACFRWCGIPVDWLFFAALTLGAVLHAVNAGCVTAIARTWFGRAAGVAAGSLFALNPVFVHHAVQALDGTPALTFFLGGLWLIASELARPPEQPMAAWRWVAASVAWAVATAFRPNYLLPWLVLPILALVSRAGGRWRRVAAAMAGVLVFAAVAGWQWRVSGVAGFLPWQGAYNLWAANQPGSHGRYYVQRHSIPSAVVARQNPARAESIYYYRQEKGVAPPDIQTLNAHWRHRFLAYVREQPVAWALQLGRKLYALLNTWEQYNNKTYAFHQARSPWLRWNPISWGVVFVLGVAGFARLAREVPRLALNFALVGVACLASVLLFYVSGRFRLPLGALAVIAAGAALGAPRFWREWPRAHQLALALVVAAASALTFSAFDRVRDRATFVQDHALLARAADTVGDDALAWTHAQAALALQPQHRDALRLAVTSYFNLLILGRPLPAAEQEWAAVCARFLASRDAEVPDLRAVAALSLWRGQDRAAALAEWRSLGPAPSAIAARLLVGDLAPRQIDFSRWQGATWEQPLVRFAALKFNLEPPGGVSLGDSSRAVALVARLFEPPTPMP